MKKFFTIILELAIVVTLCFAEEAISQSSKNQLEVLTFKYPPLMGESNLSDEGFFVELVRAAFVTQGITIIIKYFPVKRAISVISSNKSLAYIGVKNTFDADVKPHIHEYPFFVSRFLLFYRTDRFPKGFSFKNLSDLKKYRIGVLGGGITDIVGKANNLHVEPSNDLSKVFKKLDKGRSDIGVAIEFSIELILRDLFKNKASEYAIYKDVPFHTINNVLLLNDCHPDFEYFEAKLKAGMKEIAKNGQWQKILEKFYGKGNIPLITKNFFEAAIAKY